MVIDQPQNNTASKVAAGIINPVTGRRIVKTWLIDEVMPLAQEAYTALGAALDIKAMETTSIVDFYATPQMKLAFEKKYEEDPQYLSLPADIYHWHTLFNYDFGYGEIDPCYLIRLQDILPAYRSLLQSQQLLREEWFELDHLQVTPDGITYKDITASRVIFSDGIATAQNPYFKNLPFAPNKGEAVWVEIKDLPATHIFKKDLTWCPGRMIFSGWAPPTCGSLTMTCLRRDTASLPITGCYKPLNCLSRSLTIKHPYGLPRWNAGPLLAFIHNIRR